MKSNESINMSISQESHQSLKRDHDSFSFDELADLEQPFQVPPQLAATYATQPQEPETEIDSGESSIPTPPVSVGNTKREASPARSRSTSLTEPAYGTPSLRGDSPMPSMLMLSSIPPRTGSPSPSAFTALNGSLPPPVKKVKLTFAEREVEKDMKRIQKEIRDLERVTEKARKEQERHAQADEKACKEKERQAQAEEKTRRDVEKAAEKKKKEAEREQKRLVQEAEKAAKEEKKRKHESKQKTLGSFFKIPATITARRKSIGDLRSESPAPANPSLLGSAIASPTVSTPKNLEKTAYEKAFADFFLFPNVTMAPINRFERDEEASESLHCTIDSYILGNRSFARQLEFIAVSLFNLSGHDNVLRGRRCMSVKEIMAESSGKCIGSTDLTTDSQNTQIKRANDLLRKIPLKFLKFQEDVRPPYRGTYTSRPVNGIAKLARNPMRRDLPDTNYDYDSEAEWMEDEDAEDLNSEGEEDEELGEDGEDMEGFLDDENDETANSKRLVLQGDLEPISTGLCWEDRTKRNANVKMMPYRMEIILDHEMKSIEPFSTQYWQPAPAVITSMDPPRRPLDALKSNSLTVNNLCNTNSNKPVEAFFTIVSDVPKGLSNPSHFPTSFRSSVSAAPTRASTASAKPKRIIPQEDMPAFKQAIEGSDLSKIGLIEVLKKKFPGKNAAMIKGTLEIVARRVGAKEADKRWILVEDSPA